MRPEYLLLYSVEVKGNKDLEIVSAVFSANKLPLARKSCQKNSGFINN